MIIKNVQTLVFEYPEDYQAEIEWNKKRDGDWVHQSTDTMCSVYTLTNNYLIPTKAKHSFLDNAYFEAEESEPQKDCKKCKNYDRCKNNRWKCCVYEPKDEPTISKMEQVDKDINVRSNDKPSDSEKPNNCEDDEYWKHLFIEVAEGRMSDAGANQAWYEYINHKDEPQTEYKKWEVKPKVDKPTGENRYCSDGEREGE